MAILRILSVLLLISSLFLLGQTTRNSTHTPLHRGTSRFAKAQYVVPDLAERLAKYKRVAIPFNKTKFSARELQLIEKLVDASRYLDDIFWRQSDPEGLELYKRLETSQNPRDVQLRRFLLINGSSNGKGLSYLFHHHLLAAFILRYPHFSGSAGYCGKRAYPLHRRLGAH